MSRRSARSTGSNRSSIRMRSIRSAGVMGAITHPTGALASKDLNNFQPRVGLAWQIKANLVFRSSFGMITQDLMAYTLNTNFEEYFATASVQAPTGDPRPVFQLSQGPPAVELQRRS